MIALVAGAPPVHAHPRLIEARPEPRSVVQGPLPEVVLKFNETMDWGLSQIHVEDAKGRSALAGKPVFTGTSAVLPLRSEAAGALLVSWVVVSLDAHPVGGQFPIGVRGPPGSESVALGAGSLAGGAFDEQRVGAVGLGLLIRAGRSVEIFLLYLVLGVLLLRALVLRGRLALAGDATDRAYRTLLRVGIAGSVVVPLLFVLYAARFTQLVQGTGFGAVLSSSLGQVWTVKTLLWVAFAAACVYGLRRYPQGSRQHDQLLLALAASTTAAFVFNTHAFSAGSRWIWGTMMWGHVMVTAFWAGGLVALLLLVFPSGDVTRVWRTVGRFSNIMTVSVLVIIVSGLTMLAQLAGSWKGLWCSSFGVTAGFKMAVVGVALLIGFVNNRLVAYQRKSVESAAAQWRPRRQRSILQLRRVVAVEAVVLMSVLVFSAALGETELPPAFKGRVLPGEAQELVRPGVFGTGCR
jgi:putative copper export protein/methionine-rich copper-binding protein CopC